jgi:hypothetical protein
VQQVRTLGGNGLTLNQSRPDPRPLLGAVLE